MVLMAMPSVFGPIASLLAALVAVVGGLMFTRNNVPHQPYDDTEARIAAFTSKTRRKAKLRGWLR